MKLSDNDRAELRRRQAGGARMTATVWRRIRTLFLLHEGHSVRATAKAVGGYPREVSRVGKRFLEDGVEHALSDDPRPKPPRLLDSSQEAAIVALACGPPPAGRAKWSTKILAREAVRRGIVPKVGRETVRLVLVNHDLKPWRKKMWCVPEIDREFIDRMEELLELYASWLNPAESDIAKSIGVKSRRHDNHSRSWR